MIHYILICLFTLSLCYTPVVFSEKAVLNVYSWGNYIAEEVLEKFTKETGITVNYSTYESNEALYTKLKNTNRHGYDIIVPSSYIAQRMIQEHMLEPLNKKNLSNFKHIDHRLLNKSHDPLNKYTVPYLFSATGLVINEKFHKVDQEKSWNVLWDQRFKNRLLLLDDMREVFSVALLSLGFSPNTHDVTQITQAYQKLKRLLSNVLVFSSESASSHYADEELKVGMGWNGDIYRANHLNKAIQFFYPKEGYILSIDSLAVIRNAKNKKEAYRFINFLLEPKIAAKISLATGYATANQSAKAFLPKKMCSNEMIYPSEKVLSKGILQLFSHQQTLLYEKYWELLKMQS